MFLYRNGCNECYFVFSMMLAVLYAIDDQGERQSCLHPGEFMAVRRYTGLSFEEAKASGRIGYALS
jgi:hypothetical protein